jgi:hypothetical protein
MRLEKVKITLGKRVAIDQSPHSGAFLFMPVYFPTRNDGIVLGCQTESRANDSQDFLSDFFPSSYL